MGQNSEREEAAREDASSWKPSKPKTAQQPRIPVPEERQTPAWLTFHSSFQTQVWMSGSPLTPTWRGWRRRRRVTGPNGTTKPSICSPAWASAWVWATCGGSRTCVKATEEVGWSLFTQRMRRTCRSFLSGQKN